jgi:hypothetical protein
MERAIVPILNYTTKIDPAKTVGEIQAILVRHGAKSVSTDYEGGLPTAITFLAEINSEFISFRLPSNHAGVLAALQKDKAIEPRYRTEEQARRVGWRITKDWVEAQMAIVQANLASLPEVFLPYAITPTGQTLFSVVNERGLKLLTGGDR